MCMSKPQDACDMSSNCARVGQKMEHFQQCISHVYNERGRRSMSQKVEVFDRSKSDIFNVAIFKCSLYMFRETKVR